MRCCAIVEFGKPLVEIDLPTPEPAGDEILLQVTGCGVCHSDLHIHDGYFDLGGGRKADLTANCALPFCLGHEIAGTVVAMGETATGAAIGDSVVVYPWIGCGDCPVCAAGDEHFCPQSRALGVTRDGGFAERLVVPHARYLFDHGDVTDRPTEFFLAEIVREKIVRRLGAEIPHRATVDIERFTTKPYLAEVDAVIYVERASQKGIVIGRGGTRLKSIGQDARADIEMLLGKRVMLRLWVKVRRGWTDDTRVLPTLGYR